MHISFLFTPRCQYTMYTFNKIELFRQTDRGNGGTEIHKILVIKRLIRKGLP